jgi:GH15 family glucan-1,4-alpha-glucosidase
LPEQIGGSRNWDYRYCWLRDASFTVRVLLAIGFVKEAEAYMNWIMHATRLTRPNLQVVYSVYGHSSLGEKELKWLSGYKNSKPVRIGNKADGQFQLDVYGEVLDAIYAFSPFMKEIDGDTKRFILGLGQTIEKVWNTPDDGIWEVRSGKVHHTHSKVMAWVGLDRFVKLAERFSWTEVDIEKYKNKAAEIRLCIETKGYNEDLKSYTRTFNGKDLDASLLTLSLVKYQEADSIRNVNTLRCIEEKLMRNGIVCRYLNVNDGVTGKEGGFGICSFWLVENYAKSGQVEKAVKTFEQLLSYASPTGLFSEEIDPDSFELIGNYPQGFSHIGLINAALAIEEAYKSKVI